MNRLLILGLLLVSFSSQAQFWFGPKIGGQIIVPQYQAESRRDSFKISSKVNWHAGIAMDYTTESRFEVHTELTYLRVNNRTQAKDLYPDETTDSKTVNHFLTVPMMARVVFMKNSRFKVFVEAGPRLSWWLGGKGSFISDETEQNASEPGERVNFNVLFLKDELSEIEVTDYENKLLVTKPNRLQYALDLGVGWLFDISPTQRAIVDAKISWAHSNMAFNDGTTFSEDYFAPYREDMEYRSHMFIVSVAYMFGYDAALTTKGKSTSNVGGKKAKKYKRN